MISTNRILVVTLLTEGFSWCALEKISMNAYIFMPVVLIQLVMFYVYYRCLKISSQKNKKLVEYLSRHEDFTESVSRDSRENKVRLYQCYKEYKSVKQQLRIKVNSLEKVIMDLNGILSSKNGELNDVKDKLMKLADYFSHNLKSTSSTLLGLVNLLDNVENEQERLMIRQKIKLMTQRLNTSLSNSTAILTNDTQLEPINLIELLHKNMSVMSLNLDLIIADSVSMIQSNAGILEEIFRLTFSSFKVQPVERVVISVDRTENYWTMTFIKHLPHITTEYEPDYFHIERSKFLVNMLYGRFDYNLNINDGMSTVKMIFPVKISHQLDRHPNMAVA